MQSLHVRYNWVSLFKNCAVLFKIICASMDLIVTAFPTNLIAYLKEQMLITVASELFPRDQFAYFLEKRANMSADVSCVTQLVCVELTNACVWGTSSHELPNVYAFSDDAWKE